MARSPEDRLQDIADHARLILRIVGDPAPRSLDHLDDLAMAALAWSLMVIGEAVKALPACSRARHSGVDWHGFARLRDLLAHQNFRIDQIELGAAIRNDLPLLLLAVDAELRSGEA